MTVPDPSRWAFCTPEERLMVDRIKSTSSEELIQLFNENWPLKLVAELELITRFADGLEKVLPKFKIGQKVSVIPSETCYCRFDPLTVNYIVYPKELSAGYKYVTYIGDGRYSEWKEINLKSWSEAHD